MTTFNKTNQVTIEYCGGGALDGFELSIDRLCIAEGVFETIEQLGRVTYAYSSRKPYLRHDSVRDMVRKGRSDRQSKRLLSSEEVLTIRAAYNATPLVQQRKQYYGRTYRHVSEPAT